MPSQCHEVFLASVWFNIATQLSSIKNSNSPAAAFLPKFSFARSSPLILEDGSEHSPDEQLRLIGNEYPGLVIEVAKSRTQKQGGKDLLKLADKYIVRSDGSIQTVLGLAIGYRKSKKATLTVWHPLEGSDASGKFLMTKAVVSEVCQKPKTFNYILLIKRWNSDRTMVPKSRQVIASSTQAFGITRG